MQTKRGFTLIEIIIVIAVIAILAGIVYANFGNSRARARDAIRIADVNLIADAYESYFEDYGYYPPQPPAAGFGASLFYIDQTCTTNPWTFTTAQSELLNKNYISQFPCDPLNTMVQSFNLFPDRRHYKESGYGYIINLEPYVNGPVEGYACKNEAEELLPGGSPQVLYCKAYCVYANLELGPEGKTLHAKRGNTTFCNALE